MFSKNLSALVHTSVESRAFVAVLFKPSAKNDANQIVTAPDHATLRTCLAIREQRPQMEACWMLIRIEKQLSTYA